MARGQWLVLVALVVACSDDAAQVSTVGDAGTDGLDMGQSDSQTLVPDATTTGLADGQACTQDAQCLSMNCADAVCAPVSTCENACGSLLHRRRGLLV